MGYLDDITSDWQHVDGIQTVTFADVSAAATVATAKAFQRSLSFRETQAGGPAGITTGDVVWELWAATVPGKVPEAGDTITEANGTVWSVLAVSVDQVGATVVKWLCAARKQR